MSQEIMSYEVFEKDWLKRHKGSIPRKHRVSSWGLMFGILLWILIAVGAAIFSGTHTVPAAQMTILSTIPSPYREWLSLTIFSVLELTIFAGSLWRRKSKVSFVLMILAMIGALAANLGSSIAAVEQNSGDAWIMAVGIVAALLAPSVALGAGEMIHHLWADHEHKIAEVNADYDLARQNLDKKINSEYTKYKNQIAPIQAVQSVNPVNFNPINRNKPSKRLEQAVNWLNEHPEHLETESRELTQHIGVSHVTIWKAQQQIKNGFSGNGHSGDDVVQ